MWPCKMQNQAESGSAIIASTEAALAGPAAVNRILSNSRKTKAQASYKKELHHDLVTFLYMHVVCHLEPSAGSTVPVNNASKGVHQ